MPLDDIERYRVSPPVLRAVPAVTYGKLSGGLTPAALSHCQIDSP